MLKSLKCLAVVLALQPSPLRARSSMSIAQDWLCDSTGCRGFMSQGCADGWGGAANGCADGCGGNWGNASPETAAVLAGIVVAVVVVYGAYSVVCKNCELPRTQPPKKIKRYNSFDPEWKIEWNQDLLPSRP